MTGSTSRVMKARTPLSSSRSWSSSSSSKPRKSEKGESSRPSSSRSAMGHLLVGAVLVEEVVDDGSQLVGLGQDREVATGVHVQPGVRDQPGLQPRVDDGD